MILKNKKIRKQKDLELKKAALAKNLTFSDKGLFFLGVFVLIFCLFCFGTNIIQRTVYTDKVFLVKKNNISTPSIFLEDGRFVTFTEEKALNYQRNKIKNQFITFYKSKHSKKRVQIEDNSINFDCYIPKWNVHEYNDSIYLIIDSHNSFSLFEISLNGDILRKKKFNLKPRIYSYNFADNKCIFEEFETNKHLKQKIIDLNSFEIISEQQYSRENFSGFSYYTFDSTPFHKKLYNRNKLLHKYIDSSCPQLITSKCFETEGFLYYVGWQSWSSLIYIDKTNYKLESLDFVGNLNCATIDVCDNFIRVWGTEYRRNKYTLVIYTFDLNNNLIDKKHYPRININTETSPTLRLQKHNEDYILSGHFKQTHHAYVRFNKDLKVVDFFQ